MFLRRTNDKGTLELLGHSWMANAHWARRLVRAEVDFTTAKIRIYALRRSQPKEQPLLSERKSTLFPKGKFPRQTLGDHLNDIHMSQTDSHVLTVVIDRTFW